MGKGIKAVFISILAAVSGVHAAGNGTTAAGFLDLGVGARAAGMGQAYTAVADDAAALSWNPAGLVGIGKKSAVLMHAAYVDDSQFDFAAYGQRWKTGAVGVGVQRFSAGSLDRLDASGNKTGDFTPNDLALTVGLARPLGKGAWGAGVKFIQSRVVDTARTFAVDAGLLSRPYRDGRLRLGLAMRNLGAGLKYEDEADDLPLTFRAGGAFKASPRWTLSLDAAAPAREEVHGAVGTEYVLGEPEGWSLALRGGYATRTPKDGGLAGFSFGTGFGFKGMLLDYGFAPFGDARTVHRVSLSYRF